MQKHFGVLPSFPQTPPNQLENESTRRPCDSPGERVVCWTPCAWSWHSLPWNCVWTLASSGLPVSTTEQSACQWSLGWVKEGMFQTLKEQRKMAVSALRNRCLPTAEADLAQAGVVKTPAPEGLPVILSQVDSTFNFSVFYTFTNTPPRDHHLTSLMTDCTGWRKAELHGRGPTQMAVLCPLKHRLSSWLSQDLTQPPCRQAAAATSSKGTESAGGSGTAVLCDAQRAALLLSNLKDSPRWWQLEEA